MKMPPMVGCGYLPVLHYACTWMSEKWRSGYENLLMIDGEQCQTFELLTKMYYKLYSFKFVSCTNSNQNFFFNLNLCIYKIYRFVFQSRCEGLWLQRFWKWHNFTCLIQTRGNKTNSLLIFLPLCKIL